MTTMTAALSRLPAFWRACGARGRRRILLAAWLLGPILFYGLLWRPLAAHVRQGAQLVPRQRAALAVMRKEAALVRALRAHAGHAPSGARLLRVIRRRARALAAGTALTSLSMQGARRVSAVFVRAPFTTLVRLLADLSARGIVATRAILKPAGAGYVSGSVIWVRYG
ncbi:type II secretion system protein GspM [Acidiferrobacter sp.]|uniref:type II secretion system protein GspM n=1 Tax=Acidiferrobacter sp. TaxID=1872107 RepID=UPI00262EF68F|nr:type II secretion system protein GspM [Acidiferrobacter sp.]